MDEENKKIEPEEAPMLGEADEVEDLKRQLEKSELDKNEYLSGWQRSKADFINYKKDELKRLEDLARYGSEDLIRDLITVLDNFDLGIKALEKSGGVEKGIYMIKNQIEDLLRRRGLEKIKIKVGDNFDPSLAEAIAEVESEFPPGSIAEEIDPGYRLHDKLIRPARVKISKSKSI